MMRIVILISALLLAGSFNSALAQTYQRKYIKPNFFIPEKEITSKKEVLPDIVIKQAVVEEKAKVSVPVQDIEYTVSSPDELNFPEPDNKTYNVGGASTDGGYRPQQDPAYLRKYDEYISDLRIIGENGNAPVNKNLQNDLAKMNTNGRFVVEDDFGANSTIPQKAKTMKVRKI